MYVGARWVCSGCTALHVCVMYAVVTGNVSVCVYGRDRRGPVTGETGHDKGDTDAKGGGHSIAKNNTHRRSAAHTDRHFCQQDPTRMERGCPLYSCNNELSLC